MKFIFKISRVVWHLLFQLPKLIIILKFHKNLVKKKPQQFALLAHYYKIISQYHKKKDNPCWGVILYDCDII